MVGLGIFLGIVVVGLGAFLYIRSRVREFSKEFLGTEDIIEGFKKIEEDEAKTPKSLNAMTSLYLPKIKKDFPEFQYDEMKVRAQNVLTSYLLSIDTMNASRLSEGTPELKEKLENIISMHRGEGTNTHYKSVRIHRTEISNYRKEAARCIITFQMSCQYYVYKEDEEGNLLSGSSSVLKQTRYGVDVIYIQNRDLIQNEHDFAIGTNCPNCGAPLKGLGAKICEYCGTPLREINIYAWNFSDVNEINK